MTNKRKKELEFDEYETYLCSKTLARAMVEAAEGKRKLPKNVITVC